MRKIMIIIICFSLVVMLSAQDKTKITREKLKVKKNIPSEKYETESFSYDFQPSMGDTSRILMLTSYVTNDYGEIMHCLDLTSTEYISFWIEFTAIFETDVKFHFIWTGPEFYYYETDWYEVYYNDYYYFGVDTNTNWKRGVYKLIIIAEQGMTAGGAHAVMECNVKFY